jgi:protein translocase SecG subunit
MQSVATILPYVQIILSVVLVSAILLQQSGSDTGGALGGTNDSFHHTRRGFEYFLFILSIVCGILFTLSAVLVIIIKARG